MVCEFCHRLWVLKRPDHPASGDCRFCSNCMIVKQIPVDPNAAELDGSHPEPEVAS
jgi:hypothetical protein